MANVSQKGLFDGLTAILDSGKYHDLLIRCGERSWKAHRAVLCPRSKFFEKACDGSFMEGKTGEIVLEEDEPDIVDRMISYLYRLDYDDQACASDGTDSVTTGGPLIINAYIYALADKYEITVLKEVAKEKTIVAIETEWKKECFLVAIHIVWTTTPSSDRGLRRCYISIIAKHRTDLRAREDFLGVLSLHGDLAVDILKVTWGMIAKAQARGCGHSGLMTPQRRQSYGTTCRYELELDDDLLKLET